MFVIFKTNYKLDFEVQMINGISIVVPTKNRTTFLSRAIKSIKDQEYPKYEIVVVDDDPLMSGEQICEVAIQKGLPLKYVSNFRTAGSSGARNSGILTAKHNLIAFLDDDDYWLKGKLNSQLEIIENLDHKNGIVHSNFLTLNRNKKLVKSYSQKTYSSKFDAFSKKNGRLPKLSTVLLSRRVLEDCGLFDENLRAREDFDLYMRLIEVYPFYLDTKFLTISDKSHQKRSSNNNKFLIDDTLRISEKYLFLTFNDEKKLSIYLDTNLKTLLSMNQWSHSRQILRSYATTSFAKRELKLIRNFINAKYNKLNKKLNKLIVNS